MPHHCITVEYVYHNLYLALILILTVAALTLNTSFVLQDSNGTGEFGSLEEMPSYFMCILNNISVVLSSPEYFSCIKNKSALIHHLYFC